MTISNGSDNLLTKIREKDLFSQKKQEMNREELYSVNFDDIPVQFSPPRTAQKQYPTLARADNVSVFDDYYRK